MFFASLTERGSGPALVKTLVFQEARLMTIAENVANLVTPGYRAKQLDARGFQGALRSAIDNRSSDPTKPLTIRNKEVRTDAAGRMTVTPSLRPLDNVLFHDGTNASLEREMSDLAQTQMSHDLATALLKTKMDGLRKAVRGTAS